MKRWSEAEARSVLAEVERSGENPRAYGMRHGIDPQRLYSWKRRLARAAAPTGSGFLPVRITSEAPTTPRSVPSRAFEVLLAGGRVVRVAEDFDANALGRLVAVLEEGTR
jgi:transposase-like protein